MFLFLFCFTVDRGVAYLHYCTTLFGVVYIYILVDYTCRWNKFYRSVDVDIVTEP